MEGEAPSSTQIKDEWSYISSTRVTSGHEPRQFFYVKLCNTK